MLILLLTTHTCICAHVWYVYVYMSALKLLGCSACMEVSNCLSWQSICMLSGVHKCCEVGGAYGFLAI